MAKRSSTVYLEDMFWDMIIKYQEKNNLSSRNDALAFILKEWDMFKQGSLNNVISTPEIVEVTKDVTKVSNPIETPANEDKEEIIVQEDTKEDVPNVDPRIKTGLAQLFGNLNEE